MKNEKIAKEGLLIGMAFVPLVYYLIVKDQLPDKIAVHWNHKGEADGFGSPMFILLMPLVIYLVMLVVPKLDPRRSALKDFPDTYYKIRFASMLLLSAIGIFVIVHGLGYNILPTRIITAAAFGLMAFIGNYFGKLRPNWFVGIRTPWTLESDYVWRKTHLLGGRIWVAGGLIAAINAFLIPEKYLVLTVVVAVLVLGLIPVVYSYVLFKQHKESKI